MPMTNEMRTVVENAVPCFILQVSIPLDKNYLRSIQQKAVNDPLALSVWAENFSGRPSEEAIYFDEKEWRGLDPKPAPHRVDLYTIQRGLIKMLDPKYNIGIASRQMVLRSLFEQPSKGHILTYHPMSISWLIQLALFDQVVYG